MYGAGMGDGDVHSPRDQSRFASLDLAIESGESGAEICDIGFGCVRTTPCLTEPLDVGADGAQSTQRLRAVVR
jgi:hypothetical protein